VSRRVLALALVLAAAAQDGPRRAQAADSPRQLTVFAAASLREAFGEIGAAFEREHPGTHIVFSFAGSQELRLQLEHAAPADVFASADQRQAQALRNQRLVLEARTFARNGLVLVVPRGNPAQLRALRDLPRAKKIVLAAVEVPIGAYTAKALDAAAREYGAAFAQAVQANVVSRELNVRQVLAKVELGEADAGIVYRSDAQAAAGRVDAIAIPRAFDQVAEYPIAIVAAARERRLAALFVEAVLSQAGQAVLQRRGFAPAASP
jgi:molybdate transport system substrate-binding protein